MQQWLGDVLLGSPERFQATSGKEAQVVALIQLLLAVGFNSLYVFLPFYILQVSPYDHPTTLLWIGFILGATGLASAVAAPIWGAFASRISPKLLYELGALIQMVMIALMAATESLPLLFLLRFGQGIVGGTSTMGLILISQSSSQEEITPNVGLFQSAMTLGQILGPFLGAFSADLLGFRATFLLAALLLFVSAVLMRFQISPSGHFVPANPDRRLTRRRLTAGWLVCFAATLQIVFLPSVLPAILPTLGVGHDEAIRVAGVIVFAYGLASAIGSFSLARLAARVGRRRVVIWAGGFASLGQLLLWFTGSVASFTAVRVLQVGLIAAVIPVVLSQVAEAEKGHVIGFMNTSRFAGNAVGPMLATLFLAHGHPLALYLLLSGVTVATIILFFLSPARPVLKS